MKKIVTGLSLTFFVLSSGVLAQTACPAGVAPGSPQCGPDSGTSRGDIPAPPSRPTGEWIKTWGSIAGSDSRGEAWTSTGKFSKSEAETEALKQCQAAGLSDCIITLTYRNQCVSMASPPGDGKSATVAAKSKDIANKDALKICKDKNDGKCSVIYSACTDPIFREY